MSSAANALAALAAIDRIDYARPHREETRDLPCQLSPREYEVAGEDYVKAVRNREAIEIEAGQSAKAFKAKIETASADERRRLKILETHSEERPIAVKELWAKRGGEDVLVAVRLDLFSGYVDSVCYVGDRYPQPMDRQTLLDTNKPKRSTPASAPSEENLHRQADAAFAPPAEDSAPLPFEDEPEDEEEDRKLIPFPGAAAPETESDPKPAKRSRKERASTTAAKAPKAESDPKPAKAPKGKARK